MNLHRSFSIWLAAIWCVLPMAASADHTVSLQLPHCPAPSILVMSSEFDGATEMTHSSDTQRTDEEVGASTVLALVSSNKASLTVGELNQIAPMQGHVPQEAYAQMVASTKQSTTLSRDMLDYAKTASPQSVVSKAINAVTVVDIYSDDDDLRIYSINKVVLGGKPTAFYTMQYVPLRNGCLATVNVAASIENIGFNAFRKMADSVQMK